MKKDLLNDMNNVASGVAVFAATGDREVRGFTYGNNVYTPEIVVDKISREALIRIATRRFSDIYSIRAIDEGQLSSFEQDVFNALMDNSLD